MAEFLLLIDSNFEQDELAQVVQAYLGPRGMVLEHSTLASKEEIDAGGDTEIRSYEMVPESHVANPRPASVPSVDEPATDSGATETPE